jgi:hypothetical protein
MMPIDPNDPRMSPAQSAEGEEQDAVERTAAERAERERLAPREDDPLEKEGWYQPESSAQKGAPRDEEEG